MIWITVFYLFWNMKHKPIWAKFHKHYMVIGVLNSSSFISFNNNVLLPFTDRYVQQKSLHLPNQAWLPKSNDVFNLTKTKNSFQKLIWYFWKFLNDFAAGMFVSFFALIQRRKFKKHQSLDKPSCHKIS